jgi:translin
MTVEIKEIIKTLEKMERRQDEIIPKTREMIRDCSNGIKLLHAGKAKEAKECIERVRAGIRKLKGKGKHDCLFERMFQQTYQEFTEAVVLLAVIEKKEIPGYKEMGVPFEAYLLGLCDCVGEFRREMLEELKKGNKKRAEYYFDVMSDVYDSLIPIRFSGSLLPNFRRKQDVARMQVEQARSELLRFLK